MRGSAMLNQVAHQFLSELLTANELAKERGIRIQGKQIATLISTYHDEHAASKALSPERRQLADEMYRLYCQGRSCGEVGKVFGYSAGSAKLIMNSGGYQLREAGAGGRMEQMRQRERSGVL